MKTVSRTMDKCVYCRKDFPNTELTADHVIARSWYPEEPLGTIQRVTAPACRECNQGYSKIERYALQRLAACVDTGKQAAKGIWEKVFRSLRVQDAKDDRDREHRRASWEAFTRDIREIQGEVPQSALPSFASNHALGSSTAVLVDAKRLNSVIEKWALGFHPSVWGGPVEPDAEIEIVHATEEAAEIAFQELERYWKTIDQGVGVQIRYLAVRDGNRRRTVYEFTIWEQFKARCSIEEIFGD
ncbi:MAG: HNH endonuclease [Thiohalocapsa sp.]